MVRRTPRSAARVAVRRLATWAGPLMPARLADGLLAARWWAGEGVAVGLPAFARPLVLAPHPDDESLAFGGTLALLADRGVPVTLVVATDGEATRAADRPAAETARLRRAELARACAVLGVGEPRFLGHPDGGLTAAVDALAADLRRVLAEVRPDVVLLPWFLDRSADHRALNLAFARAGPPDALDVWGGEVWTPVPANRVVDVTAVVERKRAALAAHATAHGAFDLSAMLGLNRYRSLQGQRGQGYAEGFLAVPAARYVAFTRAALQGVDVGA